MSQKSQREQREQALFFMLVCYIAGIALIAYGFWWGVILVGLGFYMTLLLSSTVREGTVSILKGIARLIQNRTGTTRDVPKSTPVTPPPPPPTPYQLMEATSSMGDRVVGFTQTWDTVGAGTHPTLEGA